jgi:hypothetical protein
MKASEHLAAALDLLNGGDNWIKGNLKDEGSYCAVGAVQEASREYPPSVHRSYQESIRLLHSALRETHIERWVPEFNDAPNTTFADVEAVFKLAIKKASEEESNNATPRTMEL